MSAERLPIGAVLAELQSAQVARSRAEIDLCLARARLTRASLEKQAGATVDMPMLKQFASDAQVRLGDCKRQVEEWMACYEGTAVLDSPGRLP